MLDVPKIRHLLESNQSIPAFVCALSRAESRPPNAFLGAHQSRHRVGHALHDVWISIQAAPFATSVRLEGFLASVERQCSLELHQGIGSHFGLLRAGSPVQLKPSATLSTNGRHVSWWARAIRDMDMIWITLAPFLSGMTGE
eukprot:scaffold286977_cov31-Tisochrysis_lutea.AAC.2